MMAILYCILTAFFRKEENRKDGKKGKRNKKEKEIEKINYIKTKL